MNQFIGNHKLIKTLLKYAPVQIFSALSVFALISIQTKFLAPAEYGLLAIAVILMEFVRAICTQWLNTSMLRLYPASSDEDKIDLINNITYMTLISIIVSLVLLCLVLFFYSIFTWTFYASFLILLSAKSLFQFKLDYSRLNEQHKAYNLASLCQAVMSVILTVSFLIVSETINSAVLGLAFSYVIGLYFLECKLPKKFSLTRAKEIALYGVPLMLSGGISLLYSRADRLVMPKYLDMDIIGIYAAQANLLNGVLALIFMVVAMPLYPQLAKLTNNHDALFAQHSYYLSFLLLVTLPSLIGICLLDNQIINLFLGENYTSSSPYLFSLLAISFFVINLRQHYVDHGLQFLLKTNYLIPISTVAVLVTFCSLPFMLNNYGVDGAAFTILVASALSMKLSFAAAIKLGYKFYVSMDFFKIVCATFIFGFFIYLLNYLNIIKTGFWYFTFFVVFLLFFYSVLCLALNVLNLRTRLIQHYKK